MKKQNNKKAEEIDTDDNGGNISNDNHNYNENRK